MRVRETLDAMNLMFRKQDQDKRNCISSEEILKFRNIIWQFHCTIRHRTEETV